LSPTPTTAPSDTAADGTPTILQLCALIAKEKAAADELNYHQEKFIM
jgi:hypothetical protein